MFNRTNFNIGFRIAYILPPKILCTGYRYQVVSSLFSNSVMDISANTGPSDDSNSKTISLYKDLNVVCKMDVYGAKCEHFFHFTSGYWCFELFAIINYF